MKILAGHAGKKQTLIRGCLSGDIARVFLRPVSECGRSTEKEWWFKSIRPHQINNETKTKAPRVFQHSTERNQTAGLAAFQSLFADTISR
jgi:hypothetical protein